MTMLDYVPRLLKKVAQNSSVLLLQSYKNAARTEVQFPEMGTSLQKEEFITVCNAFLNWILERNKAAQFLGHVGFGRFL